LRVQTITAGAARNRRQKAPFFVQPNGVGMSANRLGNVRGPQITWRVMRHLCFHSRTISRGAAALSKNERRSAGMPIDAQSRNKCQGLPSPSLSMVVSVQLKRPLRHTTLLYRGMDTFTASNCNPNTTLPVAPLVPKLKGLLASDTARTHSTTPSSYCAVSVYRI
jgi:hypothetical protein